MRKNMAYMYMTLLKCESDFGVADQLLIIFSGKSIVTTSDECVNCSNGCIIYFLKLDLHLLVFLQCG